MGKGIIDNYNFNYPVLVAHRGASYLAPESTRPAVERAAENNIDYIELDVQRTKDGRLVIFHDENLLRLSNVEEVFPDRENYNMRNFTLEELKKLDFGSWFNDKYPTRASEEYIGLKILTLEDVIDIVKPDESGVGIALELKSPYLYPNIEEEIIEVLNEKGINEEEEKEPRILFLSFSPSSLIKLKELRPESPRILLTRRNIVSKRHWNGWLNLAEDAADGLGPKGHAAFPWYIAAAHKKGLFVFPYVINSARQFKILSWFSADGYITDRPEFFGNFFERVRKFGERAEDVLSD
ncbi:MAG: glycerophosphodiester phosphodiesterase family protein [Halanaerobium sp.]